MKRPAVEKCLLVFYDRQEFVYRGYMLTSRGHALLFQSDPKDWALVTWWN